MRVEERVHWERAGGCGRGRPVGVVALDSPKGRRGLRRGAGEAGAAVGRRCMEGWMAGGGAWRLRGRGGGRGEGLRRAQPEPPACGFSRLRGLGAQGSRLGAWGLGFQAPAGSGGSRLLAAERTPYPGARPSGPGPGWIGLG